MGINSDKLGLSCAKLRPAWASYQLAFVWLAFTEAAYYALGASSLQKNGKKRKDKLGLSCAKLRQAWASYQLAFVWLVFTEAAY